MADTIKRVVLPSAGEILNRLHMLTPEDHFLSKYYYPLIAEYANHQFSAKQLIVLLVVCTRRLVGVIEPDVMEQVLKIKIKEMVDVLADDPDVASLAKSYYQRAVDSVIN